MKPLYWFFYTATKIVTKVFYRFEVVNPERLVENGSALIACNHESFLDPPCVSVAFKNPIHFGHFGSTGEDVVGSEDAYRQDRSLAFGNDQANPGFGFAKLTIIGALAFGKDEDAFAALEQADDPT